MKRNLIFAFWVLLFFGFAVVNCVAQSSNNDQRIVGTWNISVEGITIPVVFNANGSGSSTFTDSRGTSVQYTFSYGIFLSGTIGFADFVGTSRNVFILGDFEFRLWEFLRSNSALFFSPDGRSLIIDGRILKKR